MPFPIFKTAQVIFKWLCIIVVIVYAQNSVREFVQNDDICEVSFKRFHSDKDSRYPTLTICLNAPFVEEKLQKITTTINSSFYESYLMGRIEVNDHLMSIDYDKVAIKVEDFIFRTNVNYKE